MSGETRSAAQPTIRGVRRFGMRPLAVAVFAAVALLPIGAAVTINMPAVTRAGLAVRATGGSPAQASTAGVSGGVSSGWQAADRRASASDARKTRVMG